MPTSQDSRKGIDRDEGEVKENWEKKNERGERGKRVGARRTKQQKL